MEDCVWANYVYKVYKGKWGIVIRVEAGYEPLHSSSSASESICLEDGVYFRSILRPYPESQPLLPHEVQLFCDGLKMVAKQIATFLPNIVITLRSAAFSDCDIQDEAFTAAAIEWASNTFHFTMPKYQVSFDASQSKCGRYVYDFFRCINTVLNGSETPQLNILFANSPTFVQ